MTTSQRYYFNHGVTFGPKARRMLKTEAAWLAGLFDGEGSIYVAKSKARSGDGPGSLQLTIVNTNLELLSKVCEVVGCGSVNKSGKPVKPNHSQKYHWKCSGMNAAKLLFQMLPWLVVKRERAVEVIALHMTIDPS